MFLRLIGLKQFRNIKSCEFELSNTVNIFKGENGQGKTNILEAIYLLATGKDFRTNNLKIVVQEGCVNFLLRGKIGIDSVLCSYCLKKGKNLLFNNKKIPVKDYLAVFPVIVYANHNMQILRGYPAERRRFIDRGITREETEYVYFLRDIRKIISNKNNLLKNSRNRKDLHREFGIWNEKLAEKGAAIILKRTEYINRLENESVLIYRKLFPESGELTVKYFPSFDEKCKGSYVDKLLSALNKESGNEKKRGLCLVGPHRDNIKVMINGKDISEYGSSGQLKGAVLSMKIAMSEIMKKKKGFFPAIAIDDLDSELDNKRVDALLEYFSEKGQVFITTTKADMFCYKGNHYRVCKGVINQQ